ncbi:MAG: sensor histidine kinase [Marinomonas sp.]
MVKRLRHWVSATKLRNWYGYGLIAFTIIITLLASNIIIYSYTGNQATKQRVYENSLWNALQFQLQSYRFLNYLVQIDKTDLPLNGAAYAQYDVLMSRIDVLRNGEVGYLIRGLTGGRTIRLLNLIAGELELISLNLSKIEQGDLSYLSDMTYRLKQIDNQINEFTVLVSKGTNKYISRQKRALGENLERVRILMILFLGCLIALSLCMLKSFSVFKKNQRSNKKLLEDVQATHEEKEKILTLVAQETRPQIQALLGISCTNTGSLLNIKESANELLHTINMFTDLALIDAKKLTLTPTTEPLQKSIEECLQVFSSKLERKGLKLVSYIDPDLPETINLDFKRMKEVLLELVQSAITHTCEGSISLHLKTSELTPTQQITNLENNHCKMLRIALKDTGFGLDQTLQKSLRSSPLIEENQQLALQSDIGLGLSLCYRLIHLMQGEIHFSSEPGTGTEFWVDIPYHTNQRLNPPPKTTLLESKRALIFTQDAHLASFIRLQLTSLNIESTRYIEGSYLDDDDIDLIIVTGLISQEAEASIQYWQEKGSYILSDQNLTISNQALTNTANFQHLRFPLTQTQLNHLIMNFFNPKNPVSEETLI